MGAPSKYTPELLEKAYEYAKTWKALGDPVPMLCGLACHCGIHKQTISKYRKEHDEFDVLCARVEEEQERVLLTMGLTRKHDNSLTKLMLMRHGYNERTQVDTISSDGSMTPPSTIEIVAPEEGGK